MPQIKKDIDSKLPGLCALLAEYENITFLGRGSYGEVYRGNLKNAADETRVLKITKSVFEDTHSAKRILRELKILRLLKSCPYTISLEKILMPDESLESFDKLILVMEDGGKDLATLLKEEGSVSESWVQNILYQLLLALAYLHSLGLVHRDVKPANILIDKNQRLRLCDFNLTRPVSLFKPTSTPLETKPSAEDDFPSPPPLLRDLTINMVTRFYRSPENATSSESYGPAIDLWSVGCVLAELLRKQIGKSRSKIGSILFPATSAFPDSPVGNKNTLYEPGDLLTMIFNVIGTPSQADLESIPFLKARALLSKFPYQKAKSWRDLLPGASEQALDLLKKLLVFNPAKRLTAREALNHPFLSGVSARFAAQPEPVSAQPEPVRDLKALFELYHYEKIYEDAGKFGPLPEELKAEPEVSNLDEVDRQLALKIWECEKRDALVEVNEEKIMALTRQLIVDEIRYYHPNKRPAPINTLDTIDLEPNTATGSTSSPTPASPAVASVPVPVLPLPAVSTAPFVLFGEGSQRKRIKLEDESISASLQSSAESDLASFQPD